MTNLCIKVTMVHLLFLATVYTYKIDFLIRCKWCTDLVSHRDYLHMLVRCEKIQKDLQVGDATWLVSKLHKELEHVLKRFTCVMVGKHLRNIQQTCSRVVLKESQPIVYLAAVLQDSCTLGDVWWALDGPGMALSDAWTPSLLLWLLGPSWSWWPGLWRHAPPLLQNCSSERNNTACMILRDRNVFRRDLPYFLVCQLCSVCMEYPITYSQYTTQCTWLSISCETNSFPVKYCEFSTYWAPSCGGAQLWSIRWNKESKYNK